MKKLLESIASKVLISEVKEHTLRREFYALLDKSLFKMKRVIENHIWVEKASVLRHEPPCFYKECQVKGSSKRHYSSNGNPSSRKNKNGPDRGCSVYPERFFTPLNTIIMVFTIIRGKEFVQYTPFIKVTPNTCTPGKFYIFH